MTSPTVIGTYFRVSDLETVFDVEYSQAARIATVYEEMTATTFPTEGKSKRIPAELFPIFAAAAAEAKKTPRTTYRTAFERARVSTELRVQRTTPTSLAAALHSVQYAREALTRHIANELPHLNHRNMDRFVGMVAQLHKRTALLQRLLPSVNSDAPGTLDSATVQDLIMILKLLADSTAGLLATDQMLYAMMRTWDKRDDKALVMFKRFMAEWTMQASTIIPQIQPSDQADNTPLTPVTAGTDFIPYIDQPQEYGDDVLDPNDLYWITGSDLESGMEFVDKVGMNNNLQLDEEQIDVNDGDKNSLDL